MYSVCLPIICIQVRPPQPPVYFFVIDVSDVSIASGMISSMVAAIKDSIDELAANTRTQIGATILKFYSYFSCSSDTNARFSFQASSLSILRCTFTI